MESKLGPSVGISHLKIDLLIFRPVIFVVRNIEKEASLSFTMRRRENLSSGFPTRSDTNWSVQPQKMATGLKFWI